VKPKMVSHWMNVQDNGVKVESLITTRDKMCLIQHYVNKYVSNFQQVSGILSE